jgi:outer membrane protein assembly factor BamB
MDNWQRRSVLVSGAALSTSGILASIGAGDVDTEADQGLDTEADQGQYNEPAGWTSYNGTIGNTRYEPSGDSFEKLETIAWQYDGTGDVSAVDGTVYLRTDAGVHAIDADDGSRVWRCENIGAAGSPAVSEDGVYVTGEQLTAIDRADGSVRWSESFDDETSISAPVAAFETVYVTADGTLYAFDSADGSLRWKCESVEITSAADESVTASYVFSVKPGAVALTNETVWGLLDRRQSRASIDADALAAFDPMTGEIKGSGHLESGNFATGIMATDETLFLENASEEGVSLFDVPANEERDAISDALAAAIRDEWIVTRGRHTLKLTCPHATWEKDGTYAYGKPAIAGDTVVVAHSVHGSTADDELIGYDLETGEEQWCFTFDDHQWRDAFQVDFAIADNVVYVNRDEGLTAVCPPGRLN